MPILFVGGGSRSGKSRYALELARRYGPRRYFLATAQALDGEMRERIARHREERGGEFTTMEEPFAIGRAVAGVADGCDCVVVDCLTLWVTNMLLAGREEEMGPMLAELAATAAPVIVVTNEVGCGIVPDNALARRFRDLAGSVNQQAAALAVEAYWMAFGYPVRLK